MSSTTFEVWGSVALVAVTDSARLERAREAVAGVVEEFDRACSRFRQDSELTAVNASAGSPVKVSRLLLDSVDAALRAAMLTAGDVDPSVGEALIALGYDRDFASIAAEAPPATSASAWGRAAPPRIAEPRSAHIAKVPGWRAIQVDRGAGTILLPRGVSLDLGATAKALAADRAAARASQRAACGVLVGLGGDIALAGPAPEDGWRIRVTDDHRAGLDAPGQWIRVRSGGLATSSTTARRWRAGGELVHHLLDPTTGHPVKGAWRTASVAAGSCLDANIASTATIVRGERALEWLSSHRLPSRLVTTAGTSVHVAGWPDDGDDLPADDAHLAA
jgi:thiamine biosynthesis lipoprotein